MEHLKSKWSVESQGRDKYIVAVGGLFIARAFFSLPNDPDGMNVAQYICDLHNKALESGHDK